jgi:hypothetical protein
MTRVLYLFVSDSKKILGRDPVRMLSISDASQRSHTAVSLELKCLNAHHISLSRVKLICNLL